MYPNAMSCMERGSLGKGNDNGMAWLVMYKLGHKETEILCHLLRLQNSWSHPCWSFEQGRTVQRRARISTTSTEHQH